MVNVLYEYAEIKQKTSGQFFLNSNFFGAVCKGIALHYFSSIKCVTKKNQFADLSLLCRVNFNE